MKDPSAFNSAATLASTAQLSPAHIPLLSRLAAFTHACTVSAMGCRTEPCTSQVHPLSTRTFILRCIPLMFHGTLHENSLLCSCTSRHLNSYLVPELTEAYIEIYTLYEVNHKTKPRCVHVLKKSSDFTEQRQGKRILLRILSNSGFLNSPQSLS